MTTFISDADWRKIEGEMCLVLDFVPFATINDGVVKAIPRSPYASLNFECSGIDGQAVGYVSHKEDFVNLWLACVERGIQPDEELLVSWNTGPLPGLAKLAVRFMPKLWVAICKQGSYRLIIDRNFRPELRGEARFTEERPLVTLQPDIWR